MALRCGFLAAVSLAASLMVATPAAASSEGEVPSVPRTPT